MERSMATDVGGSHLNQSRVELRYGSQRVDNSPGARQGQVPYPEARDAEYLYRLQCLDDGERGGVRRVLSDWPGRARATERGVRVCLHAPAVVFRARGSGRDAGLT